MLDLNFAGKKSAPLAGWLQPSCRWMKAGCRKQPRGDLDHGCDPNRNDGLIRFDFHRSKTIAALQG